MKKCSRCKVIKDELEFPFQNKKIGTLQTMCKDCRSKYQFDRRWENIEETRKKDNERYQERKAERTAYAREYRKKHPDRTRATNWKVKYGITPEDYYRKLSEQDNKCAICGRDMEEYGHILCVDHNHTTGKIRGLLCDPCNYGLGFYEKHKDKYVDYLRKHKDE